MGDPALGRQRPPRRRELSHDFRRRQIAIEAHGAGQAERAGKPATDLSRKAEGEPVAIGHEDRLDPGSVRQAQHELPAPVLGRRDPLDLRKADERLFTQPRSKLPGKIAHGLQVVDALLEEPGRKLTAAVAVFPETPRQRLELRRQQ